MDSPSPVTETPVRPTLTAAAATAAATLCLYVLTLAPAAQWGDSGKLVLLSTVPDLSAGNGVHPLRNLLGFAANFMSPWETAWTQNLVSAVFGALAVGCVVYLTARRVGRIDAGVAAGAVLAVAHVPWLVGVMAESYSLVLLFTALTLASFLRWERGGRPVDLLWTFGWVGLGMANSLIMVNIGLPLAVWATGRCVRRRDAASWLAAVAGGLLGLLLLAAFLWFDVAQRGWDVAWADCSGAAYREYLFYHAPLWEIAKGLAVFVGMAAYQFAGLAGLLVAAGFVRALRRDAGVAWVFLLLVGVSALFTSTYMFQRRFLMMSPAFLVMAVFVGYGWAWARDRWPKASAGRWVLLLAALVVVPPLTYEGVVWGIHRSGMSLPVRRVPNRDAAAFFLRPSKRGEDGADRWARAVLAQAEPGATIYADFTLMVPLECRRRLHGDRPDLRMESVPLGDPAADVNDALRHGPVYMVDEDPVYALDLLSRIYDVAREGPLWRVSRRPESDEPRDPPGG